MSDTITLTIPECVTSYYLIAVDERRADPYTVVPNHVDEPFRERAADMLRARRLHVSVVDASCSPWRLEELLTYANEAEELRNAPYQLVVALETPVAQQPYNEQVARGVARALADATGGVLVDPQAGHIVRRVGCYRQERERFVLADQWLGENCEISEGGERPDPRHDPDATSKCECLRLILRGLRRFGIPDLVIDRVACAHDLAALNLLRTLAARLLTDQHRWVAEHPGQTSRQISDHVTTDPADFWVYWGAAPCLDAKPVTVRLAHYRTGALEVGPPADSDASRQEWGKLLHDAMPPIAGWPADEDRLRSNGEVA